MSHEPDDDELNQLLDYAENEADIRNDPLVVDLCKAVAQLMEARAGVATHNTDDEVLNIALTQLAEARALLPLLAERGDAFIYDEFSSVLLDGPLDENGGYLVAIHNTVPSREQIAEAIYHAENWTASGVPIPWDASVEGMEPWLAQADAVLALLVPTSKAGEQ